MDMREAEQMFELALGGFGAVSVGVLAAVLLWLLGVKSIPMLIGLAIVVGILAKFVAAPLLGFDI